MEANKARYIPLTTGDAARKLDCSADLVRYYERLGRLKSVRTANGQRVFDPSEVEAFRQKRKAR